VPTNVLVCDELPVVREGLQKVLLAEPDIKVVGATDSGIEALVMIRRMRPDVVITDADLSGMSGIELTRRLQREEDPPAPRVLVYTLQDDQEDDVKIINFFEAGAMGMIMKVDSTETVPMAVRAVAAGEAVLAPCIARRLLDWFFQREERPDATINPALSGLSQRELEVLRLVVRGLSSRDIASELQISEATVRTHVYRLRRKLNVPTRSHLVAFAYRFGLAQALPGTFRHL
jgi:RNA polymerase sigma factor (sigma-70 family)